MNPLIILGIAVLLVYVWAGGRWCPDGLKRYREFILGLAIGILLGAYVL
tara:strand:- start:590 stop:736 length:147 start_codon:yes stop_codon:yes gene_type:complete